MSYSRWSTSHWYTYWCVQDEETENRDTAIFDICGLISFRAKDLRDDLDSCMQIIKQKDQDGDIGELETYVKRFLEDVNGAYPEPITKGA